MCHDVIHHIYVYIFIFDGIQCISLKLYTFQFYTQVFAKHLWITAYSLPFLLCWNIFQIIDSSLSHVSIIVYVVYLQTCIPMKIILNLHTLSLIITKISVYIVPVKLYTNEDNFIPYNLVYLGISKITVYIVYLYTCISCVSQNL